MRRLEGLRVLVVEDEPLVAMMLEDMLSELGCAVIGPASTIAAATVMASAEDADLALIDINLNGERSDPIAALLDRRQIPYLFSTGYGAAGLPEGSARAVIQKPYSLDELRAAILRVLDLN